MSKLSKLKPNERVPFYAGLPNLSASDFDGDLIQIPQISDVCGGILKKCGLDTKKYMRYGKNKHKSI